MAKSFQYRAFEAVIHAMTDDPTGHLPNCGYDNDYIPTCGCMEWGSRLWTALTYAEPTKATS